MANAGAAESADVGAHQRGSVVDCRHPACPDRVRHGDATTSLELAGAVKGAAAAGTEAFEPRAEGEAEHGLVLSQREDASAELSTPSTVTSVG